jgi:hypothetical protein
MTSNQVRGIPAETIEEQAVVQYLQHNADFFERHPQLLARLRLQHPRNGSTVSLIERQVEVLRDKIQTQEQKLAEFVRVARANNVLAEKIHRFTRRLLRTSAPAPRSPKSKPACAKTSTPSTRCWCWRRSGVPEGAETRPQQLPAARGRR